VFSSIKNASKVIFQTSFCVNNFFLALFLQRKVYDLNLRKILPLVIPSKFLCENKKFGLFQLVTQKARSLAHEVTGQKVYPTFPRDTKILNLNFN
jgi:hypothetical protein